MIRNALCFSCLFTTTILAHSKESLNRKSVVGGCLLGCPIAIIHKVNYRKVNCLVGKKYSRLPTTHPIYLLAALADGVTCISIFSIFFRVLDYAAGNMRARSS